MEIIKQKLKKYVMEKTYPLGQPQPAKIDQLISKNVYSWVVVEGRKRKADRDRFERDYKTPTVKRTLLNSKCNRKLITTA